MKDLNSGKVQQWLGLIMLSSFAWVTYFNFQGFFLKMVDSFMLLPFWWFLLVLPLFAMAIVWSISLGEDEIKQLERNVQKNQRNMIRRERYFRLMHTDIEQISSIQFYYYCVDVLKLLNYKEVKIVDEKGKNIIALDTNQDRVHIKCLSKIVDKQLIEEFHDTLIKDNITQGILMTETIFREDEFQLAKSYNIKCIDKSDLNELIRLSMSDRRENITNMLQ